MCMITIDYKQFLRDRVWFGFRYIIQYQDDVRGWGFSYENFPLFEGPQRWKFWVIGRLNKWA